MASLVDLFNPSFLLFLGILLLVIAVLVVYYESKMRDQNHKIASMLSLVSTLAEDMNGVKMGLNHLALRGGQNRENLGNNDILEVNNKLIEVSDGEESEYDVSNHDTETDSNNDTDEDLNNDTDEDSNNDTDTDTDTVTESEIKVIKINDLIEDFDEMESCEDANTLEFNHDEDLEDDLRDKNIEEVLELQYDVDVDLMKEKEPDLEETLMSSTNELKTISINLGDKDTEHEENIDYKKLQLSKLRSIAVEKGLMAYAEANKLKKPELLKLLGVE